MATSSGTCTPERYQVMQDRWQRISRFGIVSFGLLFGSAGFVLINAFTIYMTWLGLHAHRIQYFWSMEFTFSQLIMKALMLVITFSYPLIYLLGLKMSIERYQKQMGTSHQNNSY